MDFPIIKTVDEAIDSLGEEHVQELIAQQEAIARQEAHQKMFDTAIEIRNNLDAFFNLANGTGTIQELHDIAWQVQRHATTLWFDLRNRIVPHCSECGAEKKG